jgi:hypothetical protein
VPHYSCILLLAGSPKRACNSFFFSVLKISSFICQTSQARSPKNWSSVRVSYLCTISGASIKLIIFLTPLFFGAGANKTISFSIIILTLLLTAHIHHFWGTFNLYGKTREACDRALTMMCASVFYSVIYFHQSNRSHRCPTHLHDGLWISPCLPFPKDKLHLPAYICTYGYTTIEDQAQSFPPAKSRSVFSLILS